MEIAKAKALPVCLVTNKLSSMKDATQITLQSKIFDFALTDLVCRHRESFQPMWTVDGWVKFLIWMALNCGLSGDRKSLEVFSDALGTSLARRIRRLYFERTLEKFDLKLLADPADDQVLIMPISNSESLTTVQAHRILNEVGLEERVVLDKSTWQILDAAIAIPWTRCD